VIERVVSREEVCQAVAEARREGKTVGFVPTMGALHAGHMSLVQAARKRTGFVVVSIFVNPTQFGPGEDFAGYPRDLSRDLELLSAEGVDLVFTPSTEEMYGDGACAEFGVTVDPGPLAKRWEGAVRPGHFRGVATVVAKLLNVVRPNVAFFGEKDYQQLAIVRRMVADLDIPTVIVGAPVVRDRDGLALSSRNTYLSRAERSLALALPHALEAVASTLAWGERDAEALNSVMREVFDVAPDVALDYAAVVDPDTLEPLASVTAPARAIVAARIGTTRLIDTCPLTPPPPVLEA
jgi:pantoate--beta-alanine ligase